MSVSPGRDRIHFAALLGIAAAVVIFGRLFSLQVVSHGEFVERAEQNQEGRVVLPPRRGDLLDCQGKVLATDLHTYSVYAVPRIMKDPKGTARALSKLLDLDSYELLQRFRKRPSYCWVSRQIDPGVEVQLRELNLRGVSLEVETRREYPEGNSCLLVTGRVNRDGKGIEGLEFQYESFLHGYSGWETIYKVRPGQAVRLPRGSRRDPIHGGGLVLTIDSGIQGVVMSRLEEAVTEFDAAQATAVIIEPKTGEILAMGSAGPALAKSRRNPVVSDTYEPGSTFKIVAASAVLEENIANPKSIYYAEQGSYDFGGFRIRDTHEYEDLTLADAVRLSSNIVAGKLALELGENRFYQYATSYGFGSLTGVEYPGEVGGRLRPPHQWSGRSLPTLAIGQELAVTPLQMVLSYAVVANGGVLMRPQLIKAEVDPQGRVTKRYKPRAIRRVLSKKTAETMLEMLQAVVDSGTATRAQIAWASVAGKTGTAQKYDPSRGTYSHNMYVSSFVGILPADDPRLVCLVLVDEAKRGHYGGEIAAPVFRRIMEDVRRLRRGPLSPSPERVKIETVRAPSAGVPDVRLLPLELAVKELKRYGFRAKPVGAGIRVIAQIPEPGEDVERGDAVELILEDRVELTMPRVVGLTVREALAKLSRHGIRPRVVGRGVVSSQVPSAGAQVSKSRRAVLHCRYLELSEARAGRGSNGRR